MPRLNFLAKAQHITSDLSNVINVAVLDFLVNKGNLFSSKRIKSMLTRLTRFLHELLQVSLVDMESFFARLVPRIAYVKDDEDPLSANLKHDAQRLIDMYEDT